MTIGTTGMEGFSERGIPADWDWGVGEVYGYRWWKMQIPPELAGMDSTGDILGRREPNYDLKCPLWGANNQQWIDGRMEAACKPYRSFWSRPMTKSFEHEPPEWREACGCGFWAYFDPQLEPSMVLGAVNKAVPVRDGPYVVIPIFGVVKGTGRVIIGEKGFRSQYAEIAGLCVSDWAVSNLSHSVISAEEYEKPSNYSRLVAALRGNVSFLPNGKIEGEALKVSDCPEKEIAYRVAMTEALLETSYPSARMMSSQDILVKYFPPDKNYANLPGYSAAITELMSLNWLW